MQAVKINIGVEDIVNFYLHFYRKRFSFLQGLRIAIIGTVLSTLIGILINPESYKYLPEILGDLLIKLRFLYAGLFVFFLLLPKLNRYVFVRNLKKMYRKNPPLTGYGDIDITIDSEGIHYKNAYAQAFIKWAAIQKIEQTRFYLFFYNSGLSSYIIPKRSFRDDTEYAAFFESAEKYFRASRTQQTPGV